MRFMSCEYAEVRELIRALIPKISGCEESFDVKELACIIIIVFQKMRSNVPEVRNLLRSLIPIIKKSDIQLDAEEVFTQSCSFSNMLREHEEVDAFFSVLLSKTSRNEFGKKEILFDNKRSSDCE